MVERFTGGLFVDSPSAATPAGPLSSDPQPPDLRAAAAAAEEALLSGDREAGTWVLRKPGDSITTRLGRIQRELRAICLVLNQVGCRPADRR